MLKNKLFCFDGKIPVIVKKLGNQIKFFAIQVLT